MHPQVDLVIVFRFNIKHPNKQLKLEHARKAEQQYALLLETLHQAGLRAVGRRGEKQGHLLVLLSCPLTLLAVLMQKERQSDFLFGLPMSNSPPSADPLHLSPADRLRLIHGYVTSNTQEGGLGIEPGSAKWDLVDSVMALHDREFNEAWIRSWTTRQLASVKLGKIREQFGDSVALYFSFLSSYTRALIFPAVLGLFFYLIDSSYSIVYSFLLLLWSVSFVEWWRVHERVLALRWGTRDSFRVEKRRSQYTPNFPWWKREFRVLASVPMITLFAGLLAALLTAIFIFEAFVTHLYTGPGNKYVSFSPTILFIALVPRVLAIYQASAVRFTIWENHAHMSTHTASLTLKTFALTAIVAYIGLALSAFVYVPFGEGVMQMVQVWLHEGHDVKTLFANITAGASAGFSRKVPPSAGGTNSVWADAHSAGGKLNPRRLRDQMFAYTVTNQAINTFMEIGLPFILRFVSSSASSAARGKGKRVVFEDEAAGTGEEREFLEGVRKEVALPEYDVFVDYNEMVTQFGYVSLWSTIWPLAPAMALVNNFLELRSDAFKITVHNRRPTPTRTDTIGPWLNALTFLTWLSALTNTALVYLFRPEPTILFHLQSPHAHAHAGGTTTAVTVTRATTVETVAKAALIALGASHGYVVLRAAVRHVVERAVWTGNQEVGEWEASERQVKARYLRSTVETTGGDGELGGSIFEVPPLGASIIEEDGADEPFWDVDEGMGEIKAIGKEA